MSKQKLTYLVRYKVLTSTLDKGKTDKITIRSMEDRQSIITMDSEFKVGTTDGMIWLRAVKESIAEKEHTERKYILISSEPINLTHPHISI